MLKRMVGLAENEHKDIKIHVNFLNFVTTCNKEKIYNATNSTFNKIEKRKQGLELKLKRNELEKRGMS